MLSARKCWHASVLLLCMWVVPATYGQTFWVPTNGGNWLSAANWDNGIPDSIGAFARFGRGGTGNQTVTVDGDIVVGRITFGPTFGTSNFGHTLSGGSITLNNGISDSLIERLMTTGTSSIQSTLFIEGNNALTINNDGLSQTNLTINSLVGNNSTVTINNSSSNRGVVVVQNATYGGITNLLSGILRANDGVGLPTGTSLRINGGLWEQDVATTITRSLGTGAGNIQLLGQAGFGAFNGQVNIRLNNGSGQIQWGSANFNPTLLGFGRGATASGSSDVYVFENGLDLNGATRTIGVGAGSVTALARLTGNLVNTSGTASGLTIDSLGGGGGTLELTGTNTYNGLTTINGLSTLRANDGVGLSSNTNLLIAAGVYEAIGARTFSRTLGSGAGQVRMSTFTSGFSAFGGTHTIQLNGGTDTIVWGSSAFNPQVLRFGSNTADAVTDFQNGIDLNGGVRFLETRNNVNSTSDFGRISGVVSNSGGTTNAALVVTGNGIVEFTGANTYNMPTVITSTQAGAVLRLAGNGSFANSPLVIIDTGETLDVSTVTGGANFSSAANRFQIANAQTLTGTGSVTGNVLVGAGATIRGGTLLLQPNIPTGLLTVNGNLRIGGADATLAVDVNGQTALNATVSRVAVAGTGNNFDIDTSGGPIRIQLLNDQNLTQGMTYTYNVGSASGNFTLNGNTVSSYTFGTDFTLSSASFVAFNGVSLVVNGSNNLILTFTPVPEPVGILAITALTAGVVQVVRRRRQATSQATV